MSHARAHANIALVKYWGKLPGTDNRPAVPSLSLTLDALYTDTQVEVGEELDGDLATLGGQALDGRPLERITRLLDEVRRRSGARHFARVTSANSFPTAAGLASSASGFAALALAALKAYEGQAALDVASAIARRASASAARSVFGGFAILRAGADAAERLAAADQLPLSMLIAVTSQGAKSTSSTAGMLHTAQTSPYYSSWVKAAPELFERASKAVRDQDFSSLGQAMEQSTLMMHASMFAAAPALIYWLPASLAVIQRVKELRTDGLEAYFTMDAGPHVKILVRAADMTPLREALAAVPGVYQVLSAGSGPDAHIIQESA